MVKFFEAAGVLKNGNGGGTTQQQQQQQQQQTTDAKLSPHTSSAFRSTSSNKTTDAGSRDGVGQKVGEEAELETDGGPLDEDMLAGRNSQTCVCDIAICYSVLSA